jgi:hypothetical protein
MMNNVSLEDMREALCVGQHPVVEYGEAGMIPPAILPQSILAAALPPGRIAKYGAAGLD